MGSIGDLYEAVDYDIPETAPKKNIFFWGKLRTGQAGAKSESGLGGAWGGAGLIPRVYAPSGLC